MYIAHPIINTIINAANAINSATPLANQKYIYSVICFATPLGWLPSILNNSLLFVYL
jgi:hypothetical protein